MLIAACTITSTSVIERAKIVLSRASLRLNSTVHFSHQTIAVVQLKICAETLPDYAS
jgi:hypothetical protein